MVDLNNPAVKLCQQGMQAEAQGEMEQALELYLRAWQERRSPYEGAISAHYIGRRQEDPAEAQKWHLVAVEEAGKAPQELVRPFLPSLYYCVGQACESQGDSAGARSWFEEASRHVEALPADGYGAMLREAISKALT